MSWSVQAKGSPALAAEKFAHDLEQVKAGWTQPGWAVPAHESATVQAHIDAAKTTCAALDDTHVVELWSWGHFSNSDGTGESNLKVHVTPATIVQQRQAETGAAVDVNAAHAPSTTKAPDA